jgi:two-component system, LuxR family, response regulator FixJ
MIYLVDDDKSVRRGFELFLKSEGLEYKSSELAQDFLSEFKPGKADLLILDLSLPGMNGCDLLEKLSSEGINIPVIVVTAFDDQHNREFCRQHGVKAYLRKPVDGNALMDTIKYIILAETHLKHT